MKYGLIHYNAPGDTFEEFLQYAKETGFDSVEVSIADVWVPDQGEPEAQAEQAKALLDKYGIAASALSANNDFVQLDEEAIAAQVTRMEHVAKLATIVGADCLRTEGGQPKDGVPEDKWAEAIAGCLNRCLDFCEALKVKLAVDNHGYVTNDPDVMIKMLELAPSPWVGTNLDTMNYRWWGNELDKIDWIYTQVAPRTFHTHLKDGTGSRQNYVGAALGDGEINLKHAVSCLVKSGYKGVWCAEYEGREDTGVGYAKCLKWMKANCP